MQQEIDRRNQHNMEEDLLWEMEYPQVLAFLCINAGFLQYEKCPQRTSKDKIV